jgi:predicted ATPase/DNA-binding XRE family transcriptional regulator
METLQPPSGRRSSFGALLHRYRVTAGLTQEELAERAGLSVRNLRALERGAPQRPQRATIELLAAALTVPFAERAAFVAAARGRSATCPEPAPPPAGTVPPFAGRARELALLDRQLTGQGPPVLLLAGEPGIGKSRLLQAAAARAVGHGLRVLAGGCQRQGGQMPYTPLLEALQQHLEALRPAELRSALQGCAWLVRLLPELADGPIEPLPAWSLPPEQERRLLVEAVKRVLANVAAPSGVLLVLDDLQWAGPDALDLLSALARATADLQLRVVGAYRDTEVQADDHFFRTLGDLAQAGLAQQQHLGPLAPAEADWLLEQLAPASPAPPERERVLLRAGGVPFFLVSWAQTLQDESATGNEAGLQGDVPWTVAQGVQHRLAALPREVRELVGVAAVAGRVVPRALLAHVTGRSEQELLEALEVACRARLLEEEGAHGYRFAHDVIREVVEGSLGMARRTALHHHLAQTLAAEPAEPPVEAVAYHYARTEDHAVAALRLERAGADS